MKSFINKFNTISVEQLRAVNGGYGSSCSGSASGTGSCRGYSGSSGGSRVLSAYSGPNSGAYSGGVGHSVSGTCDGYWVNPGNNQGYAPVCPRPDSYKIACGNGSYFLFSCFLQK